MAKTYTYPCTLYLRGAESYTGTYYVHTDTSTCYIGKYQSNYYRTAFEVESAVPAASKITAATLRLNVSDHGSSTATFTFRLYQRSGSAGYTDATVSYTTAKVQFSNPGDTVEFDATPFLQAGITSLIIISPTEPPYNTAWVGFTSAELVVTTNEVDTYTVTYNKGSYGTGTNTTATKTQGTALTLKGAIFTRTGYTQKGWSLNANGSSKKYELNGSYTTDAAVTLYPYWVANTYTVTFNPNGGTVSPTTQTVTYGSAYGTLPTPTRTGGTFGGWMLNGKLVTATTVCSTASNHTLTAYWSSITCLYVKSADGSMKPGWVFRKKSDGTMATAVVYQKNADGTITS